MNRMMDMNYLKTGADVFWNTCIMKNGFLEILSNNVLATFRHTFSWRGRTVRLFDDRYEIVSFRDFLGLDQINHLPLSWDPFPETQKDINYFISFCQKKKRKSHSVSFKPAVAVLIGCLAIAKILWSLFFEVLERSIGVALLPIGTILKGASWLLTDSWKKNERLIQLLMKEKIGMQAAPTFISCQINAEDGLSGLPLDLRLYFCSFLQEKDLFALSKVSKTWSMSAFSERQKSTIRRLFPQQLQNVFKDGKFPYEHRLDLGTHLCKDRKDDWLVLDAAFCYISRIDAVRLKPEGLGDRDMAWALDAAHRPYLFIRIIERREENGVFKEKQDIVTLVRKNPVKNEDGLSHQALDNKWIFLNSSDKEGFDQRCTLNFSSDTDSHVVSVLNWLARLLKGEACGKLIPFNEGPSTHSDGSSFIRLY